MAILLPISADKLPKDWDVPDTRNIDFANGQGSIIDQINEAGRRAALAREAFDESYLKLKIRPELVAELYCTAKDKPDWCSITIASNDINRLVKIDDDALEKLKDEVEALGMSHATVDIVRTPFEEDLDYVFLIKRSMQIRNVSQIFADGVIERLLADEQSNFKITPPVNYEVENDHSHEVFQAAKKLGEAMGYGKDDSVSKITDVIADSNGFGILVDTLGRKNVIYVPADKVPTTKDGDVNKQKAAGVIARAGNATRELAKRNNIDSEPLNWAIHDATKDLSDISIPLLTGAI